MRSQKEQALTMTEESPVQRYLGLRRSDRLDALRKVPLFSDLSRRHLDLIARHADEVKR